MNWKEIVGLNDTRKMFLVIWILIVVLSMSFLTVNSLGREKTKLISEPGEEAVRVPDGYTTIVDLIPVYVMVIGMSFGLYVIVGLPEIEDGKGRRGK